MPKNNDETTHIMKNSNNASTCAHETSNLVFSRNNQTVTTSLLIAGFFNIGHDKILRSIRELECSDAFRERNFTFAHCKRRLANGTRKKISVFYLSKNGFILLMESLPGKVDTISEEAYLNAFDGAECGQIQYLNNMLVEKSEQCAKTASNYEKDLLSQFGFDGFPVVTDIVPPLLFRNNSLEENLCSLLATCNDNTLSADYFLFESMAREKEINRLRQGMQKVVAHLETAISKS